MLVTGCDDVVDDAVQGSGSLVTEAREVSGFDEIVVLGSGDVVVDVTGLESLEIEAEDNIMPLLRTEVRDGRLELGSEGNISTTQGVTYTITAAALQGVIINGSGDVAGAGIDSDSFSVDISGSGNVDVSGTAGELRVDISGSGEFGGEGLESTTGTVRVSGSGEAVVNVTDALDVAISGSGDVVYLGNPNVTEEISGSGSVSPG